MDLGPRVCTAPSSLKSSVGQPGTGAMSVVLSRLSGEGLPLAASTAYSPQDCPTPARDPPDGSGMGLRSPEEFG